MFSFGSSCGSSRGSGQLEHYEGSTPASLPALASPSCLPCVISTPFHTRSSPSTTRRARTPCPGATSRTLSTARVSKGGGEGMTNVSSAVGRFDACVEPCLWAGWALSMTYLGLMRKAVECKELACLRVVLRPPNPPSVLLHSALLVLPSSLPAQCKPRVDCECLEFHTLFTPPVLLPCFCVCAIHQ